MPGIFGGVGCTPDRLRALRQELVQVWGGCESQEVGEGVLGGHALALSNSVYSVGAGLHAAVDGERALYSLMQRSVEGTMSLPFAVRSGSLETTTQCKGNVAVVDEEGLWHIAVEWTGSFPLYYSKLKPGLVFSSHLRPLARALDAIPDPVGILEYLTQGYTVADRTPFQGIARILPGQHLAYDPRRDTLVVRETSRAWCGTDSHDQVGTTETTEHAWRILTDAVQRCIPGGKHALMMSGGWDSRTLLAALRAERGSSGRMSYTHGDLGSREVDLVNRICRASDIELLREGIDAEVFDPAWLERSFSQVENVIFPHWHRAGELLRETGAQSVSAGVYGELLGGHYGPAMHLGGARKVAAVAKSMVGAAPAPQRLDPDSISYVTDFLHLDGMSKPWYLDGDFWDAIPQPAEAINSDIDAALQRLLRRGPTYREQLIEAFTTEHRGSQHITAQLLSCRGSVDIAIPFADRELFLFASRLPLASKIHNRLNREMLRSHDPELLRFSCAATLVPASAPLLLQEGSRLVRRLMDDARWRLNSMTEGRISPPRMGWVNFEFLRDGKALHAIAESLTGDLWDRKAIANGIGEVVSRKWNQSIHPVAYQLLAVFSMDLMLKNGRAPLSPVVR